MNPYLKIGCVCVLLTAGGRDVQLSAQQPAQSVVTAVSIAKAKKAANDAASDKVQPSAEKADTQTTETDDAATEISDLNLLTVPDLLTDLDAQTENPDTEATDEKNWPKTQTYWRHHYHRQVTPRVFSILKYPYYPGGLSYPVETLEGLAPHHREIADDNDEPAADAQNDPDTEPGQSPQPEMPAATEIDKQRYLMESIFELCHHWRQMNEAEGTTLEMVRTIELTRTTTRIYQVGPQLAVDAKQTIGQIGRTNRKFDLTSRLMIEAVLAGEPAAARVSRLEKQLTDLETLLARLAVQNDKLSEALGMGKIERGKVLPEYQDRIDYSAQHLPEPVSRLP